MLEKIFHLLSGYVEFEVYGDGSRLFTMAAKQGFNLWGFDRRQGRPVARIKPREYKRLRPIIRRCQVRTKNLGKAGLPFQLLRVQKRKSLLLGAAAGAALYVFLSGFIWGVSVTGGETGATPAEIRRAAQAYGVFVGARKSDFSPKNASYGILNQLPGLSWANVNTDGCFVEIALKEGAGTPALEDKQELSNIVAGREGQVVEIVAQQGRPEVALGDTVTQGQLLIAGLYQEAPDPYAAQPLEPFRQVGPARGQIIAETYREFTVQVSAQQTEWVESGRQTARWAELFGLRIPLGLWSKPEGQVKTYREANRLTLLGVELPLGFQQEVTVFLTGVERTLSEEELRTAALLKLREAQKAALPEGGSVKQEELEFVFADGMCILSAKSRCLEDIGVERIITVE